MNDVPADTPLTKDAASQGDVRSPDADAGDPPAQVGPWIMGTLLALLSLVGLFMAAYARDDVFHIGGLLIFAFGVLFIFRLIGRYTGRPSH